MFAPVQYPSLYFYQAVHRDTEIDATIFVVFDLLGVVPFPFPDERGREGVEPNLDFMGLIAPDSFYKIVLDEINYTPRVIAIDVENTKPFSSNLENYLVSVDSIESKIGIDFFMLVAASVG